MTNTTRTYGNRYDRDRTVNDDAAAIRADIKAAQKAGDLPADWTFSVRYRTASQMRAIDIKATSPRPTYALDPQYRGDEIRKHPETGVLVGPMGWRDCATIEASSVEATLQAIHDAYNHDGSDTISDYFDVKFYGVPTITTALGVDRVRVLAAA